MKPVKPVTEKRDERGDQNLSDQLRLGFNGDDIIDNAQDKQQRGTDEGRNPERGEIALV